MKCVWLGAGYERGLGLGFINPVGTGGVWDVCRCWASGWLAWSREGGLVLVCVCSESGFSCQMIVFCVPGTVTYNVTVGNSEFTNQTF